MRTSAYQPQKLCFLALAPPDNESNSFNCYYFCFYHPSLFWSVLFFPSPLSGPLILWPVPALWCFGFCFLDLFSFLGSDCWSSNDFALTTAHRRWICGKYVSASPCILDSLLWYTHRKMTVFQISRKVTVTGSKNGFRKDWWNLC